MHLPRCAETKRVESCHQPPMKNLCSDVTLPLAGHKIESFASTDRSCQDSILLKIINVFRSCGYRSAAFIVVGVVTLETFEIVAVADAEICN